jgi:hypothetical protein
MINTDVETFESYIESVRGEHSFIQINIFYWKSMMKVGCFFSLYRNVKKQIKSLTFQLLLITH